MKLHQVLTGAVNTLEDKAAIAVGSVEDHPFTAYASGCDVVILLSGFTRVQIIPGSLYGYKEVKCVDCSDTEGKIAAAYGNKVIIFDARAAPQNNNHGFPFRWEKSSELCLSSTATCLSWDREGKRLLVGGSSIQLWSCEGYSSQTNLLGEDVFWTCCWMCKPATPIHMLQFSPDGQYFASIGKHDRLVKVWYDSARAKPTQFPHSEDSIQTRKLSNSECLDFAFVYLAHPRAVTGISWRKTSKYMPVSSVVNILLTSCVDNICRIWCETVRQGEHQEPSSISVKSNKCRRHLQEGKAAVSSDPLTRYQLESSLMFHIAAVVDPLNDLPLLSSLGQFSVSTDNSSSFVLHWLNNKEIQFTVAAEMCLGSPILALEVQSVDVSDDSSNDSEDSEYYVLSPSDDNELDLDGEAMSSPRKKEVSVKLKRVLPSQDKKKESKLLPTPRSKTPLEYLKGLQEDTLSDNDASPTCAAVVSYSIGNLLHEWYRSPDTLLAVHPVDGSLLVWLVDWLDVQNGLPYRQPQVSFLSRIPNVLPPADANSLLQKLIVYCPRDDKIRALSGLICGKDYASTTGRRVVSKAGSAGLNISRASFGSSSGTTHPTAVMVSAHKDGALNHWQLAFADNSSFSTVVSVSHIARRCGHRYPITNILSHPELPLLLSTSSHEIETKFLSLSSDELDRSSDEEIKPHRIHCSELIVWRVESVSPLRQSGGVSELTRVNSNRARAFENIAWVPMLFSHSLISFESTKSLPAHAVAPCACFLASDGTCFRFYQVVLDARALQAYISNNSKARTRSLIYSAGSNDSLESLDFESPVASVPIGNFIESIVSRQSGSNPGCILKLCSLADSRGILHDPLLLHVFSGKSIKGACYLGNGENDPAEDKLPDAEKSEDHFYVVGLEKDEEGSEAKTTIYMWHVTVTTKPDKDAKPSDTGQIPVYPEVLSRDNSVTSSRSASPLNLPVSSPVSCTIQSRKVCTQILPLPSGVVVTTATRAADKMSSAAVNPTCPAMYLFTTSCSDGKVRFWSCREIQRGQEFVWEELSAGSTMSSSPGKEVLGLHAPGEVLSLSCAYTGRIATLCKGEGEGAMKDLSVCIWENESSGGVEWILEDVLKLDCKFHTDDSQVRLEWVCVEDGSHILTVCIGNEVFILACASRIANTSVRGESSSTGKETWVLLHNIHLTSENEWQLLTRALSWVRSGVLVVGLGTEMQIYSQWRPAIEGIFSPSDSMNFAPTVRLQKVTEQARGGMGELVALSTRDGGHIGLFEEAAAVAPVLPQYHPKHLMELMNFGKLRRVRAILHHLVYCVAGREALDASAKSADQPSSRPRLSSMRSSSASSAASELECKVFGETEDKDGKVLVPVLPLHELLAADKETTCSRHVKGNTEVEDSTEGPRVEENDYSALFDTKFGSSLESDDEFDTRHGSRRRTKSFLAHGSPANAVLTENAAYFGLTEARLLSYQLTKKQLPGLTRIEQLELLALADTFASTKLDLEESPGNIERGVNFAKKEGDGYNAMGGLMGGPGGGGGGYATTGSIGATAGSGGDAVDECGLRFLLAMRHHTCLMRSLPPVHRAVLEEKGLSSSYFGWAFHSESEEELLAMMPAMLRGQPTWAELKEYGAGWWIRSNDTLRRLIEKVAKAQFAVRQDPIDCALFYLAMKKKNVICGLYRTVRDTRMSAFFSHNFSEDRWRKAALKNAYSLLGKQRFNHAAAFFVLAGSLWDAVQVCVRRLGDIQLAMVVARLQDEDPAGGSLYQRILTECVLGQGGNAHDANQDPFLRSIAYWVKQDYDQALETLMFEASSCKSTEKKCNALAASGNPDIFNFFLYLRNHPLLKRRHFKHGEQENKKSLTNNAKWRSRPGPNKSRLQEEVAFENSLRPMERQLFFKTSHAHLNSGCPALALQVLMELPTSEVSEPETNVAVLIEPKTETEETDGMIATGTLGDFEFGRSLNQSSAANGNAAEDFDWSKPVSTKLANDSAEAFDWSKPVSNKLANDSAEAFDWSKPVSTKLANDSAEAFDWSKPVSNKLTNDNAEAFDWSKPVSTKLASDSAEAFDWSKPVSNKLANDNAEDFDWGKPVSSTPATDSAQDLDWSKPVSTRGLEINGDQTTHNGNETSVPEHGDKKNEKPRQLDVVAQQMKFSAILKLLLEGLHGIPASCEIADEDLRPFFLRWLEKELDVLHKMSDYGSAVEKSDSEDEEQPDGHSGDDPFDPSLSSGAEKNYIALKIDRSARRLQWVKKNQTLLTILLNYCALHGASGGDLSAMNLELLLLLHEVEQTRSLVSPLYVPSAGPSVPPLILAAVSSSYSLLASPIGYLQSLTQDILKFLFRLPGPPSPSNPVPMATVLSNLTGTLSDCIYQSLTGMTQESVLSRRSERYSGVQSPGKSPRSVSYADSPSHKPTNSPSMWPGVRLLLSLLTSENRDNSVKLRVLLAEACVAVYLSLLALAWSACNSGQLYRLIVNPLKSGLWGMVFGGGVKVAQHAPGAGETKPKSSPTLGPGRARPESSDKYWNSARQRWNYKLLGQHNLTERTGDVKASYVDQFVPPRTTLMEYFTTKPAHVGDKFQKQYDSDEEIAESSEDEEYESEGEDEHGFPTFRRKKKEVPKDHLDPDSYSWCLMNYNVSKLVLHNLQAFLPDVGFELTDLPSLSPRLHSALKMLEGWQQTFLSKLDSFQGPPQDYISQFPVSEEGFPRGGPALMRYKALMDPYNTPFRSVHRSVEPVKRLWRVLTHQEPVRETFVRYIFKRGSAQADAEIDQVDAREIKQVRILHKDTEGINSFCVNRANPNCLAVGTLRDVQEVDISRILTPEPLAWMDEESESERAEKKSEETDYHSMSGAQRSGTVPQSPGATLGNTGHGTSTVLLKRSVHGTKRMDSHPHLPYYVTGSQDGSVRMWEFGHAQEITSHRTSGSHQRVTRIRFSPYGNKVGISDASGALLMWQVNSTGTSANPFLDLKCHNKQTNDFVFVGSSSFLATAGQSSDGSNVCLWDTLVPRQSALVQRFVCHESGAPCVAYVAGQQLLISGGRKGTICIFDLRQRLLLHTFPAHDAPVKSIVVDESEEFFISGSEDGDVKVWGLTVHEERQCFPKEHVKSSYLKYGTQGVALMRLQARGQLYSCGGDGTVKWRELRDEAVNSKLF